MFIRNLGNVDAVATEMEGLESSFPIFMPEIQSNRKLNIRHYLNGLRKNFALHFSDMLDASYTIVGFEDVFLIIGPYRVKDIRQYEALEIMERNRQSNEWIPIYLMNFKNLPFKTLNDISIIIRTVLLALTGKSDYNEKNINHAFDNREKDSSEIETFSGQNTRQIVHHYDIESAYMNYIRLGDTHGALEAEKLLRSDISAYLNHSTTNMNRGFTIFRTITRIAARDAGLTPLVLDGITGFFRSKFMQAGTYEEKLRIRSDFVRAVCTAIQLKRNMNVSSSVQQAMDIIHQNLSSQISVPMLAEDIGISPNRLSSIFHRETGNTITEYVTSQRLLLAADLLVMTTLSIQEITNQAGFSSSAYFSKVFREHYGVSPTEYRKGISKLPEEKHPE